ncbi:MAG: hypothetical protein GC191_20395 [Azospirillum sp.]|nr:hypothetical protein [Azospirillum sp.]
MSNAYHLVPRPDFSDRAPIAGPSFTGTVTVPVGSAATPGVAFTGDADCGLFHPAADCVAVAAGGAEQWRTTTTGLGLGVAAPLSRLDVNGGVAVGSFAGANTAPAASVIVSGKIGIGTASPANLITASSPLGAGDKCVASFFNENGNGYIRVGTDSANGDCMVLLYDNTSKYAAFRALGDSAGAGLSVKSGGAVGIGTTSPSYRLQVEDAAAAAPVVKIRAASAGYTATGGLLCLTTASANGTGFNFATAVSSDGGTADVEFAVRGDGTIFGDGASYQTPADYAEFFESADGAEIPVGTTVVLDGNRVRAASPADPPQAVIGVVRPKTGSASLTCNTADLRWAGKYLSDTFGTPLYDDVARLRWTETTTVIENRPVTTPTVETVEEFVAEGDHLVRRIVERSVERPLLEARGVLDESGNPLRAADGSARVMMVEVMAAVATPVEVVHEYRADAVPAGVTVPDRADQVTVRCRRLNPEYESTAAYIPRRERPEWHVVGLLGQVPVRVGQPVNDRWIRLRPLDSDAEEWLIR